MADMFKVDRSGLAKLLRKQGLHRMFEELISNALDEKATTIGVVFEPTGNHMEYRFSVEDNSPDGFKSLDDAYTLFAESYKKNNPLQRGRFNFGEKWVIAICEWARITSTSGTIIFEDDQRRHSRSTRPAGTIFEGLITATQEEYNEALKRIHQIIPSQNVKVSINGMPLDRPDLAASFEAVLPTVATNENGELIRTERKTMVNCYVVKPGEKPTIYELGIPVVRLEESAGDPFHVDVRQKVPVSLNRNNVPPRFLKMLRTEVVNNAFQLLSKEQTKAKAVTEGMENATPEAVEGVMTERFGEKRAIYDPSDPESNGRLAGDDYTVIPPGTFDKGVWGRIKETGAAQPSGRIRPTPKPYSETGEPVEVITNLTPGMERLKRFIVMLAREVCNRSCYVSFVKAPHNGFGMCCEKTGSLDVNVSRLGNGWIDAAPAREECINLMLDEFGHFVELNHMSEKYLRQIRKDGARMTMLALEHPELFKDFL